MGPILTCVLDGFKVSLTDSINYASNNNLKDKPYFVPLYFRYGISGIINKTQVSSYGTLQPCLHKANISV